MSVENFDRRKLLIVEDEPDLRLVLSDIFQQENYRVAMAENGLDAVSHLKTDAMYQAILCDISMPKMSGLTLVQELMARDLGHIPVVMLTAHSERDKLQEALRLGAFDYVVKPADFGQLIETVSRALELGARQTELRSLAHTQAQIEAHRYLKQMRMTNLLKLKNNRERKVA
jgi:two-component system, NtrC family, nitrogen regulation response regulator NtrX